MKAEKIKLNDLKLESFVTSMNKKSHETINGGGYSIPADVIRQILQRVPQETAISGFCACPTLPGSC